MNTYERELIALQCQKGQHMHMTVSALLCQLIDK